MWKAIKTDADYPEVRFDNASISDDNVMKYYKSDRVLIQYDDGDMDVAFLTKADIVDIKHSEQGEVLDTWYYWVYANHTDVPSECVVVAWRELPKPYKEEN